MNEITEKQGKIAFEAHQDILTLKKEMGMAFVKLGKLLKTVRDQGYYHALGYDSFQSYVINSELGFSRRTAYNYIEIYEWYVEKFLYEMDYLAELGQDKLMRLLPVLKKESHDKSKIESLMEEVRELRPVDFAKKYKDEKKQEGQSEYLAPPEYFRCSCHGKWIITVPVEDCCPDFLIKFKEMMEKKNENT
jgi:hypothetical protein